MLLKVNKKAIIPVILTGGFSLSQGSQAIELPRGPDVSPVAGNCGIGPFQQTSKAGIYNRICNEMSDAEKCLALIKGHFLHDGRVIPTKDEHDQERIEFCLEELKESLTIASDDE